MKSQLLKALIFCLAVLIWGGNPAQAACGDQCCLPIQDNLSMTLCVEYQSERYEFKLDFVEDTSSGYFWKKDPLTVRPVPADNRRCSYADDNLSITVCCADLSGYLCSFRLDYSDYPQSTEGNYWKLDLGTFTGNPAADADPLHPFQWHLCNSGQTAFSTHGGKPGEDLRMSRSMAQGLDGEGIIVAVLDSGLEIAHEDLVDNVVPNGSYNFLNHTTDPTSMSVTGDHGTSVAGIIAARNANGKGIRGVAPRASLKGFNVLENQTGQNIIEAMGGHPRSQNVHIFNLSYGDDGHGFEPLAPSLSEMYESSHTLRNGKGAIYVKSAGNGFESFEVKTGEEKKHYFCKEETYGVIGLTCQNAVGEEENSRPEVITVGAFNAAGTRSSYSTAGSNLWISAPGGEDGSGAPAILTTDQSGCNQGYSRTNVHPVDNPFEPGHPTYNPDCRYTSTFNGTSSAAPNVSGGIALMLQANSNLTRRDVKHILAQSARKIDPQSLAANIMVDINGTPYQASQGWVTNAAGFNFHNWYGFGAFNVDAAVKMARQYAAGRLPPLQSRTYNSNLGLPAAIPDNDAAGVVQTITIDDSLVIEDLFVIISIEHPDTAETGIEITSPQGTRSILLNVRSGLKYGLNANEGVLLASNAFYNEVSQGVWTLRVVDSWPGNTGTLNLFKLKLSGYQRGSHE